MTPQAWLTIAVTGAMVAAMVRNLAAPDMVLLAGLAILLATGVLTPPEAFAGFSNTGMLTIAVLFVVSAGVQRTGGLDFVVTRVLGHPRSAAGAHLRMMVPVATISAFMNNTPVVAMMLPIVSDWSRRIGISPGKLFIPLSYASIVGGSCTIIGTATNLVVLGLTQNRLPHLRVGMFEIAQLGLPVMLSTILYTLVCSRWLLPSRGGATPSAFEQAREYTVSMHVLSDSPLVGLTIEEAGLRHLRGLFLIEIQRADSEIRPAPGPDVRLHANDLLLFAGVIDSVVELQQIRGLVPADEGQANRVEPRPNRRLVEAVVATQSELIGQTVREARFRTHYNAAIIAVHRQGQRVRSKVGDIELSAGDTLLLAASPNFADLYRDDPTFALVSEVQNSQPRRHERSWISMSLLAIMVGLSAAGVFPLLTAALVAAGLMIVTRCLTADEARRSVDLRVLLTIAAAFAVGEALRKTGAAGILAQFVVAGAAPFGAVGLLSGIYVTTVLLSSVITTNAAAVLMFPIAYAATQTAGFDFKPFMFSLMLAASANFMTPIGYQTNLMVYGPGRYRFADFTRFGLPLQVVVGVVTIATASMLWL
ncbi:MAG: SLC13 family permease [Myxococcales bacterium]|nr:SLC13 family permease [Myxococcales bacterium]